MVARRSRAGFCPLHKQAGGGISQPTPRHTPPISRPWSPTCQRAGCSCLLHGPAPTRAAGTGAAFWGFLNRARPPVPKPFKTWRCARKSGYVVPMDLGGALQTLTADRSQAQYFVGLLYEIRTLTEHRIGKYTAAMTRYQLRGNVDDARRVRRMIREEEHDHQQIDLMIAALHRRFRVECAPVACAGGDPLGRAEVGLSKQVIPSAAFN